MKRVFLLLIVLTSACIEQKLCFENNKCVKIEIVKKPEDRARGLMFKDNLPEERGMLFLFPGEGYHSFWMKNMNFPIDMIWINEDKIVVHIERSVPPCKTENCPSYTPEERALYVLEVNANYTVENNITIGSKVVRLPTILAH